MKKIITFVFLTLLSCSKDSPVPDAVVPTPTLTFTLAVTASEGGSVNDPGDTHNENANVSLTATPADGYVFSGWSGDASGSTNPLIITMTGDKNITASFIRLQYSLSVNIIGSGTVSQVLVESSEKNTDYDPFSTVRLTALPVSNWIFYGWSGSTTETTNEVDIVMEETKSVTATFEEKLSQIIGVDDVFFGNGKWKIRKPKGSSGSGNTIDESSKQMLANCALSEIIFRTDGSFTIISGTTTTTGQFTVDSNTTISLTQAQSPFGTITNLVLTNNFISFSIQLIDGCSEEANGEKDDTYVESEDTSLPPVISLVGSSTIYLGVGDNFTDPGATASDNIDGDLTSSITSSGTVNTATEGTYTIVYSVTDAAGNIASVSRKVIVSLDLPPTITLIGSSTINLTVGNTYTDAGATATDDVDGDITSSIIVDGLEGLYVVLASGESSMGIPLVITYSVTDTAGNTTEVIRLVIVSAGNSSSDKIYFENNTCKCPQANVGDTADINGVTYTAVDNSTITGEIANSNVNLCTTLVTSMSELFKDNTSFNSDIGFWDTSNVTGLTDMFSGANSFNRDVSGWDLSSALNLSYMFFNASSFNQNISSWDISTVIYIDNLFNGATAFNQDIGGWDTSNVMGMSGVFTNGNFNRDISDWDTSSVTNMESMLSYNSSFNQDISSWNTSSVNATDDMFRNNPSFNQNISGWNVSSLTSMERMFDGASVFNQDLTSWCVSSITSEPTDFATNSALTEDNKPVWGTCPNGSIDTTPPVISLLGSSTINLTVGDTFTDPGATATDDVDGDITSSITINGYVLPITQSYSSEVDTSTAGTYTISFYVSDASGNAATVVQRTIIVSVASSISFANGTCQCPNAIVGDTAVIGGVTYTAVDNSTIAGEIANGNVNLCTTLVTSMSSLFRDNSSFNSDISFWDTAAVNDMSGMFRDATSFNRDISNWNTSSVTDMEGMFYGASLFNGDISNWDTSAVTNMGYMFKAAVVFNRDISNWDTAAVTSMSIMFNGASSFNGDISNWNTSAVTSMRFMFRDAISFNRDISNWNTSAVTNMQEMFRNASSFNGDISNWNTASFTNMYEMFRDATSFNRDISNWNTSSVTDMEGMFNGATSFNQDLTDWCVSNINSEPTNFLFNSALTEDNKPVWGTCPNGSVDTTPPVISLLGSSTINLTVGNTFTDPGVTATDDVDGDLTSSITVSGSVDTFNTGTYTLTYLVADSSGNQTDVSRTVIISAAATTYSISVTASSNADYTLSGTDANGSVSGDDVSITINSGDTLSFTVDAASHPFYIKTVQGTGTDNQASGVNNNGATNGTVTWTPTTAGTYYYQCSVHNGMYGTITVQ